MKQNLALVALFAIAALVYFRPVISRSLSSSTPDQANESSEATSEPANTAALGREQSGQKSTSSYNSASMGSEDRSAQGTRDATSQQRAQSKAPLPSELPTNGNWSAYRKRWPVSKPRSNVATEPRQPPRIPTRIAFRALWYLGADPQAEDIWAKAINDPNSPPGVRSDLIIDMIDEGYTDNSHPGPADLPLIQRRLEILERHAPYAMDEVNRKAFEEAYQDMLKLYLRVSGQSWGKNG
jgi:hypothetical protein